MRWKKTAGAEPPDAARAADGKSHISVRREPLSLRFVIYVKNLQLDVVSASGMRLGSRALPLSSETRIPPRMRIAPIVPRTPRRSPKRTYEVTAANTGSRAKIRAVWVGGVNCWAQDWMENAAAVQM